RPPAAAAPRAIPAHRCAATRQRTGPRPAARSAPARTDARAGSRRPPETLRQFADQLLELAIARHAPGIRGLLPDPHRARERAAIVSVRQAARGAQAFRFGGP